MEASVILSMTGGLGLFLYGMYVMSDSIEKVAGARLRKILEMFTTNRFAGIMVGFVFTALIQSSSACTSLVVSFVNAGLMNLYQAAGVIFGSNIGTTVTALLVSFKLEKFAPIILLVGVIMLMFCKNPKISKIGEVIIGFGILFLGLASMSSAMAGLKESPVVLSMFAALKSPFLAVMLGFALTAIIQSSSVTVSIMVLLANQGLLGIDMCMYIMLGCNTGSCITALLASLAGKKDAKRAAMIHFLFNIFGTIIMYIILQFGMKWILGMFVGMAGNNPGRIVAYAHMSFKTFLVILLTPCIGIIVKMTYFIIPGSDKKVGYRDSFQLKYIGDKVVLNPATAVVEVIKEIDRMASLASENLNRAMNALITLDEDDIQEVYAVEENINFLNHAITGYLVKINQTTLPIEDAKMIGGLFHVVNDIERIGDHAENIADSAVRRKEHDIVISKDAQQELGEMLDMVNTIVRYSVDMFAKGTLEHLNDIIELENAVDEKERELQQHHVDRLTRNECTPAAGMLFSDIASGLERVSDHATNIAFSIYGSDNDEED